jgi:hypothetical protein
VTDPRFRAADAGERRAARARFGLPPRTPLALLVAGSWGVGPVRQVAREIRDSGAAVPVVVCGRNHALADQLRADGIEHTFGWTDDMPGLMHAADVLVQNAGGLTSLEALATGLPVASYRCIPGHGLTNAAALHEAGIAAWIRDPADLGAVLADLIDGPAGRRQRAAGHALFAARPDDGPAAEVVRVCRAGVPYGAAPRGAAGRPHTDRPPTVRPAGRPGGRPGGRLPGGLLPGGLPLPRPSRLVTVRRLAATGVAACAVWAGAVGTGIAATHDAPGLLHAVHHRLDPDDIATAPSSRPSRP